MSRVAIVKTNEYSYPKEGSFHPSADNHVYDMVLEGFKMMGLDAANYGTSWWNPLGNLIIPGNTVVLKPNWVMDVNPNGQGVECLYTQPSVVAPIIDYVIKALENKGKIIVGDAPMQECDFDNLMKTSGYDRLKEYYENTVPEGISISFVDFRGLKSVVKDGIHYSEVSEDKGIVVDLKDESEFAGESAKFFDNMRITNYDPAILKQHHNAIKNEYYVSKDILSADVIINIPKPKTHRKAGVTISLKNLVGINARKEYLPHHTNGAKSQGGDEYLKPSVLKKMADYFLDKQNYYSQTAKEYGKAKLMHKGFAICSNLNYWFGKDKYMEGSWYGNDTISRTIIDLNKILMYADKNGVMQATKQRKYLIVADMIISGEKEGPVEPSPKNVGIIAMGDNPVTFDETIGNLMGADISRIPTLIHARNCRGSYLLCDKEDEALILSNDERYNNKKATDIIWDSELFYIPTSGWIPVFNVDRN